MISLSVFVLTLAAVARVTRLLTDDAILGVPRRWLIRRAGEDSLLAYLAVCPWCVSVWTGAAASVLATPYVWPGGPWWGYPATALALSYGTGMLSNLEGE